MSVSPALDTARPSPTRGEAWERVAFTFCRAGTIVLFAQLLVGSRYILPFVALSTALLYGVAVFFGKRDTRCILRVPWVVIAFWGVIGLAAVWLALRGSGLPSLVN